MKKPVRLPKTLEHLALNTLHFKDMSFLSDLISLKSLELISVDISKIVITYIVNNCIELQSLKLEGEILF